ncbi:MAG: CYTH domain-containing protein [Thermodesulfobacteriota bacterium]
MGIEIERKFLVRGDGWRAGASGQEIRQGYLSCDPDRTVRVRLSGHQGLLTVKGRPRGLVRTEFEYPIPGPDAQALLDHLCLRPLIEKTRYRVTHVDHLWEVDEFWGENRGLVLAEVELADPAEAVDLPEWAGEEVSHDPRYANANLARNPFLRW